MPSPAYAVTALGNAIVDVLARADEALIAAHNLPKGAMSLLEGADAQRLYDAMRPEAESSGGSAANTVAGMAALGGRTAFVGKVADDPLGAAFARDIRALGVHFNTPPAAIGPGTGRCMVLVTPDAQRTMGTWLGAAGTLAPDDIDPALIAASGITYLEGYLWDPPGARAACRRAAELAHQAGRRVALSLSDPFCVERHRNTLREFVADVADIVFANERELMALYRAPDFASGVSAIRDKCSIAALTRSEHGSVVTAAGEVHEISALPVAEVVDTTGAGDLYAAGFLHTLTSGRGPAEAGRAGSAAAARVLGQFGARLPAAA